MPKERDKSQRSALLEVRSIDYIPESERHGSLYSQFTLWLGCNLQITALLTGSLAVVLGGDVFWSLIGLMIGQVFGGAVMALHAAQGPKLGLPQMISSRVQFGVYGAVIPIVLVALMYLGFNATGAILSGQAVAQLANISTSAGILIFAGLTMLMTIVGYRLIHIAGRAASIVGVVAFCYLFVRLIQNNDVGALLAIKHFDWGKFLLAISLSASWQIAYGPYVADYSRYLPSRTSSSKTILAVGLGSVIGAQASMVLGVLAAALAGDQFAGHEVSVIVGLGSTGVAAALIYFSIAFGKLTISTLNAYGSFMCAATVISGFRGYTSITPARRAGFVLCIVGASTIVALIGESSFIATFKSFILFLLAFFTPWSAINLVDFYFVSKDKCDLQALSDPDGEYGRWNILGVSTYVFGIVVQLPFLSTSLYTGMLVERMNGVDISWLIGLVVPGVIYYVLAKRSFRSVRTVLE